MKINRGRAEAVVCLVSFLLMLVGNAVSVEGCITQLSEIETVTQSADTVTPAPIESVATPTPSPEAGGSPLDCDGMSFSRRSCLERKLFFDCLEQKVVTLVSS
jgi:hypothetical protein